MTPTVRTDRLVLEPYQRSDEETFVGLFTDEEVIRWVGAGPMAEPAARALFGRVFSLVYAENRFDVWAVRVDGHHIGHAEIKPSKDVDGHELVYLLAKQAWGRGLGTELVRAVVEHGFHTLGLTEIYATVHEENASSLRLLAKVGFQQGDDILRADGHVTKVLVCRYGEVFGAA